MNEVGLPAEVRAVLLSVATPVEVLAGEDVAEQGVEGSIGVVSAGRFAVTVMAEGSRSRTIALVATLHPASVCTWPRSRACLSAARVSAVSPDCDMAMASDSARRAGER
jgi:hypothetical protein